MKILITGATGFIGSALVRHLTAAGHEIHHCVRSSPASGTDIYWNPDTGELDRSKLENFDAAIHLAGENIAEGRWTEEKKARIRDSRVKGTKLLSESIAGLANRPKVFLTASGVGFYGNRGDAILTESDAPGTGFLAEVCQQWEAETSAAAAGGIRVAMMRLSLVLGRAAGALKKMLPPFKMGVGGNIGSGEQYWPWIAIDDVVRAFEFTLNNENLSGPVNCVAPTPVTNAEFTSALGKVLRRPTVLDMPSFAARVAFGEMADEMLLASDRVEPQKLIASGFVFRFPDLEEALYHVLK